jgi:glycosyltransferase involved in cell wall biosynthesis
MLQGQKVVVVMPALNAARMLRQTYNEVMAQGIVDEVILVDDGSRDSTAAIASELEHLTLHVHKRKLVVTEPIKKYVTGWPSQQERISLS